jgi:hypothetical protein
LCRPCGGLALLLSGKPLEPLTLSPNKGRVPHIPDFLWGFVGSQNFMRLSLKKGAHAVLFQSYVQEIRASVRFWQMWDSEDPGPDRTGRPDLLAVEKQGIGLLR